MPKSEFDAFFSPHERRHGNYWLSTKGTSDEIKRWYARQVNTGILVLSNARGEIPDVLSRFVPYSERLKVMCFLFGFGVHVTR